MIFDGINLAGEIDPNVAIVLAGLMRTRNAVEGGAAWIQRNCVDKGVAAAEGDERVGNAALSALEDALEDEDV